MCSTILKRRTKEIWFNTFYLFIFVFINYFEIIDEINFKIIVVDNRTGTFKKVFQIKI